MAYPYNFKFEMRHIDEMACLNYFSETKSLAILRIIIYCKNPVLYKKAFET